MRNQGRQLSKFERFGLISRGDHGPNGGLLNESIQHEYYNHILEKLTCHQEKFPNFKDILNNDSVQQRRSLDDIVQMYRKLREGLFSSRRMDTFSIKIYQESSKYSLLSRNYSQALTSLSHLIQNLYSIELNERNNFKNEYISYYLLYQVCYLRQPNQVFEIISQLQLQNVSLQNDPINIIINITRGIIRNDYILLSKYLKGKLVWDNSDLSNTSISTSTSPPNEETSLFNLFPCHYVLLNYAFDTWIRDRIWSTCVKAYIHLDLNIFCSWASMNQDKDKDEIKKWISSKETDNIKCINGKIHFRYKKNVTNNR